MTRYQNVPATPPEGGFHATLRQAARQLYEDLTVCAHLADRVFTILEESWKKLGGRLIDFKLEFGRSPDGTIVVADVIDCDSWRVMWEGIQLSKQPYREGADLGKMIEIYRIAAARTDRMVTM